MTHLLLEQIQEIIWRYDKGCSLEMLAQLFKVDFKRIKKILAEHDIEIRQRPRKPKIDFDIQTEYDGKLNKGMSYADYLKQANYRN